MCNSVPEYKDNLYLKNNIQTIIIFRERGVVIGAAGATAGGTYVRVAPIFSLPADLRSALPHSTTILRETSTILSPTVYARRGSNPPISLLCLPSNNVQQHQLQCWPLINILILTAIKEVGGPLNRCCTRPIAIEKNTHAHAHTPSNNSRKEETCCPPFTNAHKSTTVIRMPCCLGLST